MVEENKSKEENNTAKNMFVGGVAGALLGAPVLGMAVGAIAANKEKIKKGAKKFDDCFK